MVMIYGRAKIIRIHGEDSSDNAWHSSTLAKLCGSLFPMAFYGISNLRYIDQMFENKKESTLHKDNLLPDKSLHQKFRLLRARHVVIIFLISCRVIEIVILENLHQSTNIISGNIKKQFLILSAFKTASSPDFGKQVGAVVFMRKSTHYLEILIHIHYNIHFRIQNCYKLKIFSN